MVISIGNAYAGISATLICLSSDWAPVRSQPQPCLLCLLPVVREGAAADSRTDYSQLSRQRFQIGDQILQNCRKTWNRRLTSQNLSAVFNQASCTVSVGRRWQAAVATRVLLSLLPSGKGQWLLSQETLSQEPHSLWQEVGCSTLCFSLHVTHYSKPKFHVRSSDWWKQSCLKPLLQECLGFFPAIFNSPVSC